MSRIPFTIRIEGRYSFRRRIHFRNIISKPLTLALQTADPAAARERVAILSARFVVVKSDVNKILGFERKLTGDEIEAIFRHKLEAELQAYLSAGYEDESWSSSVTDFAKEYGEAFRFLRHPDSRYGMTEEVHAELVRRGLGPSISTIESYVEMIKNSLDSRDIIAVLNAMGIEENEANVASARTHMIRAGATASSLVQRMFDEDVLASPNPLHTLTADLGAPSADVTALIKKISGQATNAAVAPPETAPTSQECQFAIYDKRHFSEIIEDVLSELKQDKIWKGDLKQQRRIMQSFAWITGDRELGSYDHRDVARFKNGLKRLPTTFRFGSPSKGAMSRPFEEVISEIDPITPANARNLKTVNRDLSTMSTVAKHLALTSWKPRIHNALIMDFASATVTIQEREDAELRPPWKKEELECLFRSPLYQGGGAGKNRLKTDSLSPQVWHDAAYWAPLIWYYTHACREEICGLEVADVFADHPVPHLSIRENLTRGRDGEKAGEKRIARRRKIPLHDEILRLGFLDYVAAVRAEGHTALFPELYLFESKRGGAQFYDRAWRYMVQWITDRMEVEVNDKGKGPDIHSIRALGSSFYEVDGVNEIMRADIMGHARTGTNAKHYSKRIKTEGLEIVLKERLEFIQRYVPEITLHLDPSPIRMLPIEVRSRVGSGRHRRIRSDAGVCKTPKA